MGRHGLVEALDRGELDVGQSRDVYYLIAASVGGAAVGTVMHVPEGHGVAEWRALEGRCASNRVSAKFSLLRKLMAEKCTDAANAEEWINGELRAARKLTTMGVSVDEVALLGILDNLPDEMKGVADMVLASGNADLSEAKRLVLEKKDAVQRMEVDTAANLSTQAGRQPSCMWCGENGHWAAKCPSRTGASSASAQPKGPCFKCSKMGHVARNCLSQALAKGGVKASVATLLHAATEPTV